MEPRKFKTYVDMQVQHQKDIEAIPMSFVFGYRNKEDADKQVMADLKVNDMSEVTPLKYGGYVRKADLKFFDDIWKLHDEEHKLFLKDSEENLVNAIVNEMYNHEYGYTLDPQDTLMALGKSESDLLNDTRFANAWTKAKSKVLSE
ncbi:DUF7659 family protein [Butyrivibrio hungatei]|uniref:Uncharacterized protein n=1 Tax=Butyrivibrio hungatei TaxID=185008 RepID=A0A1D9P5X4_9FIRM|nr:hypothetical protein [Butyrivibrio hungatei]AOZ97941.1 hypothetical protein bhn_II142 [Butyrivibrio hungatei]